MKKIEIYIWVIFNKLFFKYLPDIYWNNLVSLIQAFRHHSNFYWINHNNKSTLNEIISFQKFKKDNDWLHLAEFADKSTVKKKLRKYIHQSHLIPTIFEVSKPEELIQNLTNRAIILKLNTGSGKNFILPTGLSMANITPIINEFKRAMHIDQEIFSREKHYSLINPKIIAEPLISDNPLDYKIFFKKGKPVFVQVDTDRFIRHKRNLYDLNWNKLPIEQIYENDNRDIPRPKMLNTMIWLGKKIMNEEKFEFARIDFYEVENHVYFGEITFFPEGGIGLFKSKTMDLFLGRYLTK